MAILCGVTAYGTHVAYITVNKAWVTYRDAEDLYQRESWNQAVETYEQAYAEGLKYPEGMQRVAEVYSHLKQFRRSAEWYGKYLEIYPNNRSARKAYADMLVASGDFDAASEQLKIMLDEEKRQQ